MKFSVLQENLLKALARTARVVPVKPQLPVIGNVLFAAKEEGLVITATNLETTESVGVGAKVEKEGSVCISSRLLLEFVSTLPQGTVQCIEKEGSVHIESAGYHAVIPTVPAAEFPHAGDAEKGEPVFLAKTVFVSAIAQVVFAAASDEGRPLLTGIRILEKDGVTQFAATDGFRLSLKRLNLKSKDALDLLVPARALGEVMKVSQEEKSVEKIALSKRDPSQMSFTVGDTEIVTRLIDGDYPNFEKIIPVRHNTRVLLDKSALLSAVKSAAIFARDNANIIKLHIENQTVTISANTPQIGENRVELESKVDGEGGDMAINSRFLLECLNNFPGDEVLFEMTGSLNPGVFKPAGDDSYLHIIMPVRVQG